MAKEYNFQYTPLTGRLSGNSFVKQTEQAINELAEIVNEGSAQVEVLTNLANTANDNAEEALDKATEALDTASRIYITLPNAEDVDDYFESQLYYLADSSSDNLPVEDTGFLEVKTNDTKTAAEQVFIADTTGLMYMRHGVITSSEVGSETVYSVTWETWSSALASEDYVQSELLNYLPLSGGTLTGVVNGITPTAGDSSTKIPTTEFTHTEIKTNALGITTAYMTEITSGADLNTYLTAGSYRCGSSTVAASLVNTPYTGSNFTLLVIHGGNPAKYARQILFTTSDAVATTNLIYTRSCDGSGNNWTSWKQIAYFEEVLPLSGGTLTGALTFSDFGGFNVIQRTVNGKHLAILGGNDYTKSASISLAGGSENSGTIYQGSFSVRASKDDGTYKILFGSPDGTLTWGNQPLLPVGIVQAFAGTTIPNGWLLCDGSAVSRTTYANLFACIGTTYGAGDGSTTFNVPNLVDKFIQGNATAGTEKSAGLPNITGSYNSGGGASQGWIDVVQGVFTGTSNGGTVKNTANPSSGNGDLYVRFDASNSNAIYGNSTTVQPPALTMKYIIKY